MTFERECSHCRLLYTITLSYIEDNDPDDQARDDEVEPEPEFCPFCGAHESDDSDDEEDK
jgi:hypothetical protein